MDIIDCIDMVNKYIEKIEKNSSDKEKVADYLIGLNRCFSVMTASQKTAVLDWLVGRLIELKGL